MYTDFQRSPHKSTSDIAVDNNIKLTFKSQCFWYLVSAMACSLSSSFLLVSRIRCSTGRLLVGLAFCKVQNTNKLISLVIQTYFTLFHFQLQLTCITHLQRSTDNVITLITLRIYRARNGQNTDNKWDL